MITTNFVAVTYLDKMLHRLHYYAQNEDKYFFYHFKVISPCSIVLWQYYEILWRYFLKLFIAFNLNWYTNCLDIRIFYYQNIILDYQDNWLYGINVIYWHLGKHAIVSVGLSSYEVWCQWPWNINDRHLSTSTHSNVPTICWILGM